MTGTGFTIDPVRRRRPRAGFAVGVHPERAWRIAAHRFRAEHVARFIAANRAALALDPRLFAGAWLDCGSGLVHLDLSVVEPDRRRALALARRHRQLAVYDLAAGRTLATAREAEAA